MSPGVIELPGTKTPIYLESLEGRSSLAPLGWPPEPLPARAPVMKLSSTLLDEYAQAIHPTHVAKGVQLGPRTTFQIGGPADLFVTARTSEQLIQAVGLARESGIPYFLLGRGANILVGDAGFRGVVIRCDIRDFAIQDDGSVTAGSGLDTFPDLINATVARGLGGLHHFVGIPSTVGGAVWQNLHFLSPAPDRERTVFFEEVMVGATILAADGGIREVPVEYFDFGYDYSTLHDTGDIVLSVELKLDPSPIRELRRVVRENLEWRDERHPDLWLYPCAGSIFKKIEGIGAGRLIDECGLKGRVNGAAQIFRKHANIIVNLGGASAKEVIELIELARDTVRRELGHELEREIELVGSF